jgi:hypothetical protein
MRNACCRIDQMFQVWEQTKLLNDTFLVEVLIFSDNSCEYLIASFKNDLF